MTVREQLEAWGIDPERLLDLDMSLDHWERLPLRDPLVQAWCEDSEMEIRVTVPSL